MAEELGRVTRAYVSGYQRTRVHRTKLVRGEKRHLIANFNGAIPVGRTISSATWRTNQNNSVYMADAAISGRDVTVNVTAQIGYAGSVKCEVTLDNGEVYNQIFEVRVMAAPWFTGEPPTLTNGPYVLTVTAP